MRVSKVLVTIITLLTVVASAMAKDTGDLQITCKPGIRIYLDDSFAGTTKEAEDGLYIQDIKPGQHEIRAEKEDYMPQVFPVTIEAGKAIEIKIGEFSPRPKIRQEGESDDAEITMQVGKVIITSIPLRCQVSFLGNKINKDRAQIIAEDVTVGKYEIIFNRDDIILREEINVESEVTLNVQGDFRQGKIIIERNGVLVNAKTNKPLEAKPLDMKGDKIGKDGMPMMLIPAGEFQMGSNNGENDEKPVHTVYLDAFYIDKYTVTNAQYKKFMGATRHKAPKYWNDPKYNAPKQPVVGVSWQDAVAYAKWADKRLPTEAEWEKAARGGLVGKKYPWGDNITNDNANYGGTGGCDVWNNSSPLGSFAPNGYGLYDMAGNVWEWCADWYGEIYYANSPKSNPTGPSSGTSRVLRGGSWLHDNPNDIRVSYRYCGTPAPTSMCNDIGFRCAE